MATFGDPFGAFEGDDDFSFPDVPVFYNPSCRSTPSSDPLCDNPLDDIGGTAKEIIENLGAMWDEVDTTELNEAQKEAVKYIALELPKQALFQTDTLIKDILKGNIQRWMLTYQHFLYGIDGSAAELAKSVIENL